MLGAALFVVAAAVAGWFLPQFTGVGGKPWFYQYQFGPAVMTACGHGYVNVPSGAVPALDAFLDQSRDAISCSEVNGSWDVPLTSMQRAFRYLITTVGWTWRLQGRVAWSALTPLYVLIYGVTVVLAFAIFRQLMGPLAATLCAGALALSTQHLNNLPHLRDYAKAPFVLALAFIAIRLVASPVKAGRTLRLAAAAGLVAGIGIGFRNDLLVGIPAVAAVLAVFLPVGLTERAGLRLTAIAIFFATVYVAMLPMRSIYTTGGGNSTQHLMLLGLTRAFSDDLGVDNSRLYEWGFEYRDELALAMIDNYADRRLGEHRFQPMYSAEYDRAATGYLTDIGTIFPADMLTRVYASAVRVTELPYSSRTSATVTPTFMQGRIFATRLWLLRTLSASWPWAFAMSLLILSFASVRLGLFAALFVLYLSGYPALQFQERHIFHLEFIGWCALGLVASFSWRALAASSDSERRRAFRGAIRPAGGWLRAAGKALALWCALGVMVVAPLWALRSYQQGRVRELLGTVSRASREDIQSGHALLSQLPPDAGVHAAYLVAELGGPGCDALTMNVTERYAAAEPQYDFTHTVPVPTPLSNDPVQLYFPAYFHNPESTGLAQQGFAFSGLELPVTAAGCLTRLSRLSDLSPIPLLLDLQLRPGWEQVTPYETISGVEARSNPPAVYAFPADLPRSAVKRAMQSTALVVFQPDDILKKSKTFRMAGSAWQVAGAGGVGGRGPLLYLVEMKPRPLPRNSLVVAHGRIDKGGVTFGLVRNGEWVTQLHVRQTGIFDVAIRVPADGEYKFVMANNLLGMSLDNRVEVMRVGMIPPAADEKMGTDALAR